MATSTWAAGDSRIAGIFNSRDKAVSAKEMIVNKFELNPAAAKVIEPGSKAASHKLEGSSDKIGESMLWLHLLYGSLGLFAGLGLGWLLVNFGPNFTQLNPTFTYIAMLSPGLFIGLFLSGLLSLKPQHDAVNQAAVAAVNNKEWTLIIKLDNEHTAKSDIAPLMKQAGASSVI
ncbi:hypothetical protein ACFO4O_09780 [Glaciecola siphonariae]|uniref:Uncharacterized protein n=1 Tax=Glaciecola siphonariae TaxID=521012 RepID=A0ABV9LVA5_9ALTE